MAFHSRKISIVMLFFIISTFTVEAHNAMPPSQPNAEKAAKRGKDVSNNCPEEYIEDSLEDVSAKCKDFVTQIEKKLKDVTLTQKEKECLMSCYGGYQAAIGSITRANIDVSTGHYKEAAEDVGAFTFAIAPCKKCTIIQKLKQKDNQFLEFQKWAKYVASDARKKLDSCK